MCTLKNFPYQIEHTIQWSRDQFEGLFKGGPGEVNNYLTQANYLEELAKQQNVQLQHLTTVKSYLIDEKPKDFADCIKWARLLFEDEYNYKISQLLYNFPADSQTAEGQPFWSGTKRPPQPILFDLNDSAHIDFIESAANLRAFNYQLKQEPTQNTLLPAQKAARDSERMKEREFMKSVCATIQPKPFVPQANAKIATTEAEAKEMLDKVEDDHEFKVTQLISSLPVPSKLNGYHLHAVEFEKDSETNFHIDFITACSNLRARNYKIKESDKHETKFIAGKIIPAIATTTALVTGMVCLEIYKLLQPSKRKVEDFRCFSCNLALPLLSSSDPIAPAKTQSIIKGGEQWNWSLWDRIEVDIGDCTLEQFMEYFKTKYELEVTMLSHGASMLFYNFGVGLKKKVKDRLKEKISDLVTSVGGTQIKPKDKYLILEACVQNAEETEVEIPFVKFKFRQ